MNKKGRQTPVTASVGVLNRHWVWTFLWLAAGMAAAPLARSLPYPAAALLFLIAAVVWVIPPVIPRRSHIIVACACFGAGMLLHVFRSTSAESDLLFRWSLAPQHGPVTLEGYVRDVSLSFPDDDTQSFILHCTHAYQRKERFTCVSRVRIAGITSTETLYNDMHIRVHGVLVPQLGRVNHGIRGMEDFYHAKGVFTALRASRQPVEVLGRRNYSPLYWASRLRQQQADLLWRHVPENARAFVLGVWLGERNRIHPDDYQDYVRTGTAHILSVSGIHVAIIAMNLGFLLRLLNVPRPIRALLMMGGVLLFSLVTGARVATMRSALMVMVYLGYDITKREPDPLSAFGLSGTLFLVWNPGLLHDIAFLLSFGSVGAILLFHPLLSERLRFMPSVLRGLVTLPLAAQLATMPVVAWHFNLVPLAGIAANFVVVPLLTVALWVCLLFTASAAILPPMAIVVGHALSPIVAIIEYVNRFAASAPGAYAYLARPTVYALAAYLVVVCMVYLFLSDTRRRTVHLVAGFAALIMTVGLWNARPVTAGIDILDVGQGDAAVVRTPGGKTLLIDAGDKNERFDSGRQVVVPFLLSHGVRKLDYVVMSHAHRDHAGGLLSVLEAIPTMKVVMPPQQPEPSCLERILVEHCRINDIPVHRAERGHEFTVGGARVEVLHPEAATARHQTENNRSLVIRISWPGMSVLFPGDIEKEAEAHIRHDALQSRILKVPHHGSATSCSPEFLARVSPEMAVVSLGPAGHKASSFVPSVEKSLNHAGADIWRTDWHGGIRIREKGTTIQVLGARRARGYDLSLERLARRAGVPPAN